MKNKLILLISSTLVLVATHATVSFFGPPMPDMKKVILGTITLVIVFVVSLDIYRNIRKDGPKLSASTILLYSFFDSMKSDLAWLTVANGVLLLLVGYLSWRSNRLQSDIATVKD